MKKLIIVMFSLIILLTGCGQANTPGKTGNKPSKLTEDVIAKFPINEGLMIKDNNPDLLSMSYLIKHAKDYGKELHTDKDDFFVIVKGKITDIKITDYSKEDLSDMNNQDAAELLKNTISYDYYLDGEKSPLTADLKTADTPYDIEKDHSYYFMVSVQKITDDYSFNILNAFDAE